MHGNQLNSTSVLCSHFGCISGYIISLTVVDVKQTNNYKEQIVPCCGTIAVAVIEQKHPMGRVDDW